MGAVFPGKAYMPECVGLAFQREGIYLTPSNATLVACESHCNKIEEVWAIGYGMYSFSVGYWTQS